MRPGIEIQDHQRGKVVASYELAPTLLLSWERNAWESPFPGASLQRPSSATPDTGYVVGSSTRRVRQEAARGCLICRIGTNIQRPLRIARRTLGKIPRLSQVTYASRLAASEKRVSTWRWRERVHVSLANQLDGTEAFCLQETPCDVPGDLRLTAANHFGCLADRVVVWQNHHRAHTAIVRHVMRIAIGISCRDVLRHKAAVRSSRIPPSRQTHPAGLEPATYSSVGYRSIQLKQGLCKVRVPLVWFGVQIVCR